MTTKKQQQRDYLEQLFEKSKKELRQNGAMMPEIYFSKGGESPLVGICDKFKKENNNTFNMALSAKMMNMIGKGAAKSYPFVCQTSEMWIGDNQKDEAIFVNAQSSDGTWTLMCTFHRDSKKKISTFDEPDIQWFENNDSNCTGRLANYYD